MRLTFTILFTCIFLFASKTAAQKVSNKAVMEKSRIVERKLSNGKTRLIYKPTALPEQLGHDENYTDYSPSAMPDYRADATELMADGSLNGAYSPAMKTDAETTEQTYFNAVTTAAGTLAEVVKDMPAETDSLIIEGPINADDFNALWSATFDGNVTVINLEKAQIEGNKIPDYAFYKWKEQYIPNTDEIAVIKLRRIMLSDDVEEIGNYAFQCAVYLENINIPKSLRKLGMLTFHKCFSLYIDHLVLPEGIEEIPGGCFEYCWSLDTDVVLPSTIKKISYSAFFASHIKSIYLPEGLESLYDHAFSSTHLKEALLPNSCQTMVGTNIFSYNYELEKIRIPESLTAIPQSFAFRCPALKELHIPENIDSIKLNAFVGCDALTRLDLPEGLKYIGGDAFWGCKSLEEVVFPSTLEYIGDYSCNGWENIKRIYCKATVPPECGIKVFSVHEYATTDIPLYVPKGTAELYRNAQVWGGYFTNIVETDDFTTGIDGVRHEGALVDVYAENGGILIAPKGGSPVSYTIVTLDGKAVASGTAYAQGTSVKCARGYHVVKAGKETYKIFVD